MTQAAKPRRVTPARSERRHAIAAAALGILGRRGLHALTHRAVDQELSLPTGSCSYYFNSRLLLVCAATDVLFQRDKEDLKQHVSSDGRFDIDSLLRHWTSAAYRDLLLARIELFLASARDLNIHVHLADQRRFFTAAAEEMMARNGARSPKKAAERLMARIDGELLRAAAFNPMPPDQGDCQQATSAPPPSASLNGRDGERPTSGKSPIETAPSDTSMDQRHASDG